MRNSFTSMPRAPMRGDVVAPKKQTGFGALAEERVAKQAQQKMPVKPKDYPNPEWDEAGMQKQMPAQAPKQMQAPQPQPKQPTGGLVAGPGKVAQPKGQRAAALDQFAMRIKDPNAVKKATTADMAGADYGRAPAPSNRSGGTGYGNISEDASGHAQDAGVTGGQGTTAPSKFYDKSQNPGPGYQWDSVVGVWKPVPKSQLPAGVSLDDPGWDYTEKDGWQYDPNKAGGSAIDAELAAALKGTPEDYGMSPEMKAQAKQNILNQAAQAKADLSQTMAGRGLGASGLTGAGFGQIDVGTMSTLTDLDVADWQAGVDNRINELKTLLTARGNELSEKNRREIADKIAELESAKFEDQKAQQAEADTWTAMNNLMAQAGADAFSPGAWALVMEQLSNGVSPQEAFKSFTVGVDSNTGLKTLRLDPKYAPPPPDWKGTLEEWRQLSDEEMNQAYEDWKAGSSYDDEDYVFTEGTGE